ncbi:cysteine--tRNA ligase [Candidatus Parcubacteria bacterium]|nr:MAG: cysteine--tRNA ligase [Candidatus Parcubacteria bacterium]
MKEQINLIKILEEKGFTYKTSDGIYFDTSKLKNYGRLAGQLLSEKVEGARIEKNPEKKNSVDFALWKFSQPGVKRQMEWESPWGVGFPGWHIECSAMSEKYLGSPFDIHTGGEDHISVHHPNEMAQTEAARGHNLANWWLHNAFLLVDGGKMSKSLGNTYSLDDLRKRGFDPLDYRYFVLGAHYRVPQNFTWQALRAARQARLNLINEIWQINGKDGQINADYVKKFQEKINDDLDMPGALSVVWQIVKDGAVPAGDRLATVLKMDEVLGLRLSDILKIEVPDPVKRILKERKQARLEKNYELSDKLREELKQYGFGVKDEPDGQKLILQF